MKKQKYIYYHCTGYVDKCQDNPASCRRRYVRQEVLEQQFTALLGRLQFDDEVLAWVREALHASHADTFGAQPGDGVLLLLPYPQSYPW